MDRPNKRRAASLKYYAGRDNAGGEHTVCAWCGEPTTITIPYGWKLVNDGKGASGQRAGVCLTHLREKVAESVEQAAQVGYDARPYMRQLTQI